MTWERLTADNDPVPASTVYRHAPAIADPRGMRAAFGNRALGWRYDLRVDAPVVREGRSYIPVLTEHDWYRAEAEQLEVFAPLVPIERIWIEVTGEHQESDPNGPNAMPPVPATQERRITGRRVIYMTPGLSGAGERNLRAISEIATEGHETFVLVCAESEWYRWAWSGRIASARRVPPGSLWVE